MSALLNEEIISQIKPMFEQIQQPVVVLFFKKKEDCDYCAETRHLLEEVTALSEKLSLKIYDIQDDYPIAADYRIEKAPGVVIAAQNGEEIVDYGIRFAGIPSGHEFTSLIFDLIQVSKRDSGLNDDTRQFLTQLEDPIHLQVFVTPTCPYCPQAVTLAHQMAMESNLVEAEMVEATEFPELASRFGVSGVPHTTINQGASHVVGAVPEDHLVDQIRELLPV